MARIAKRVLRFRERHRRGEIMRPSTFAEIEREAAAGGMRDPRAVAGAAYWKTLAAKYRNPSSVYAKAASLGYPYIRGEGKPSPDGRTWLGRFTKKSDPASPAVYVGWDDQARKWIVEYEGASNPRRATLDGFTKQHLEKWLANQFAHAPQDKNAARRAIMLALAQEPELLAQSRSWPEIMRIGFAMQGNPRNPSPEARELYLWITSGPTKERLYRQQGHPIELNLAKKYQKGKYDHALAPKLWKYFADTGAKDYCREHGCTKASVFPKRVLEETAQQLADEYYSQLRAHGGVLRGGNPRAKQRKFRDVAIGETFEFWDPWHSSMTGPWMKKSARTYVRIGNSKTVYRVGSITAKVFPPGVLSNPDGDDAELSRAEDLYKTFHGREPREILELTESAEQRGEYVALGDLVELTIISPEGDHVKLGFKQDGVRVASSPEGTQLYLLAGNQDISGSLRTFGADESKDLIDLGDLKQIVYDAAKWQTDFTPQEWKHDLGEESGIRPRAFFDQLKKRIFFAGGTYAVKRPGIVD